MSTKSISNLIITKLIPPHVKSDVIRRTLLIQQLDQGIDSKLILVSAPAGFGKTTLVVDWLHQQERPFAWVALDDNDNDLSLFLSYFISAIRSEFPDACTASFQLLQSTEIPYTHQFVNSLINDLLELPRPLIVVLDDYHLIYDKSIHEFLNLFLQSLPDCLQLVICSRTDPFLPLSKLRGKGQLVEVRANELRFTHVEAQRFFDANDRVAIDHSLAIQLNERVEGWPVGLRLAALSLSKSDGQAAWLSNFKSHTAQFFTEYLINEVFSQQSESVQEFFLYTALLDRFCVDIFLAIQASGFSDWAESQAILEEIKSSNIFIVPLDEANGWYRYHHLFQDMLRQKLLSQVGKQKVAQLRQRAAHWFVENGLLEEAFKHALLAGDMETAVTIVEDSSKDFLNGLKRRTLERWMDSLPEEIVWQRPKLLTAKTWLHYRHWNLRAMEQILDRIAFFIEDEAKFNNDDERQFIQGQMHALRSTSEFHLHLNYEQAIVHAKEAFRYLPETEGGALGTAHLTSSSAYIGQAKSGKAVQGLTRVLQAPSPHGPAKIQLLLGLGADYFYMGNFIGLMDVSEQLMTFAAKAPLAEPPARWLSGLASYELNKLDEAVNNHEMMFQFRYRSNFLGGFQSALTLARVNQIRCNYKDAQYFLDEIKADILRLENADMLTTVTAHQAFHWWQTGDVGSAYRWAQGYDPSLSPLSPMQMEVPSHLWARIMLALGNRTEKTAVKTYLIKELTRFQSTHFNHRKVQIMAHLAAAYQKFGEFENAQEMMKQAMLLGQVGGHIRSFLDVGDGLVPLLQELDANQFVPDYVPQLLQAFGAKSKTVMTDEATLLTMREAEILNLMAAGKSNQEIAESLVISIHTAKRHASNIYNKFDVNGRRQAIHKAKQLGILS